MKQVVKVSIAGVSFAMESDAHQALESYLKELEAHYAKENDGEEIIADIEERIAELLIEKGGKSGTVPVGTVKEIIAVLGNPAEIEQQESPDGDRGTKEEKPVKKLYRDLKDRVVGGVCSGIGAYFGVDAVMIRLIFVLLALLSAIFKTFGVTCGIFRNLGGSSYGFMLLFYILLWIIIPAARTVGQRCAMRGKGTGIDDLHKEARSGQAAGVQQYSGKSTLAQMLGGILGVVGIFIGALFILTGFGGLIGGMVMLAGIEIVEGVSLLTALDYIHLGVDNLFLLKLLCAVAWFIPFLLLIYWGVLLCFKFKTPAWRPGLIMFILWGISIILLVSLGFKSVTPYMDDTKWSDDKPVASNIDTLYLNLQPFDGIEESVIMKDGGSDLIRADYLHEREKGELEFVKYPQIRIVKHSPMENGEPYHGFIECRYRTYNGLSLYGEGTPIATDSIFTIKDSVVAVRPRIYTKQNKFRGERITLWVHLPAEMCVVKRDERGNVTVYDK